MPDGVQGYDRYAYANNNPVLYNDPTGHVSCNGVTGYICRLRQQKAERSSRSGYFPGYSSWEEQILLKLIEEGGSDAVHGVAYIVSNRIHITLGSSDDWQTKFNVAGWYDLNANTVVLDPRNNSVGKMPSPWDLSTIIHEAYHMEQKEWLAKSVLGEMQAGHIGIGVFASLEGKKTPDQLPDNPWAWAKNAYSATTPEAYHAAYIGQTYWWNLFVLPCYPGESPFAKTC